MNKNVLITGGNSGIGYATAKFFKEHGYLVYISGRNAERVQRAAAELDVEFLVADIGNTRAPGELATNFLKEGLDVLVNNAAIAKLMPLTAHTKEDYNDFFNINIKGQLELIKELLPALEKRAGSVVNVSSAIVNNGAPCFNLYAATKGAVEAFTKSLAIELAPRNIRINAVSPGAIDTPIFTKLGLSEEDLRGIRDNHEANIPLRRYGRPEEVAQVIYAQAEATYVTGAIWQVDGGVNAS